MQLLLGDIHESLRQGKNNRLTPNGRWREVSFLSSCSRFRADDVMIAGLFGKPQAAVERDTCSIQALPHSSQQNINE